MNAEAPSPFACEAGDCEVIRSFSGGSFGWLASSSLRLQDVQMNWNLGSSTSSSEMPWHFTCCHTLHFSHDTCGELSLRFDP